MVKAEERGYQERRREGGEGGEIRTGPGQDLAFDANKDGKLSGKVHLADGHIRAGPTRMRWFSEG